MFDNIMFDEFFWDDYFDNPQKEKVGVRCSDNKHENSEPKVTFWQKLINEDIKVN